MPSKENERGRPSDFYHSFEPHTMQMLDGVVEEAWQELKRRNSPLAQSEWVTRELLAHRVMARASRGELDPQRLKEHALWGLLG